MLGIPSPSDPVVCWPRESPDCLPWSVVVADGLTDRPGLAAVPDPQGQSTDRAIAGLTMQISSHFLLDAVNWTDVFCKSGENGVAVSRRVRAT